MLKIPNFGELCVAYPKIAAIERLKSERPCQSRVRNVLCGVQRILHQLQIPDHAPITSLSFHDIDLFLSKTIHAGLSPTSAWSYVQCLRAICAHWTLPYYKAMGWNITPFEIPAFRRKPIRYVRPDSRQLQKVKAWYEGLTIREDRRLWLAATLMLEFAMRNGDVGRLRWADFYEREGLHYLHYTPRKTSLTSGRTVSWPVHPQLWTEFARIHMSMPARGGTHFAGLVVPAAGAVFRALNADLRKSNIFAGSKGCYELRKICVDHVYQRYGAEMASSISGDDIRTVTRYYADPSAVNFTGVRIVDLL